MSAYPRTLVVSLLKRTAVLWWAVVFSSLGQSQVVSVADTIGWAPWRLPNGNVITDPYGDKQTGQYTDDFVGNSATYAFQQKAGTIGGTNYVLLRGRMSEFAGVNSAGSSGMNLGVGFNLDNSTDGSIDLVMVMSKSGFNPATLQFGTPGSGANDGPSTTTWTFPSQTAVTLTSYNTGTPNGGSATFYIQSATAVDGVRLNTSNPTKDDAWVTFGVSFATLENAARTFSKNPASFSGYTVTYSTAITMIGFTSTQTSALNQDLAGVSGGVGNNPSTLSFATLGASTTPTTVDPVPEASTFLMVPALLIPAFMLFRRRRSLV